MIIVCDLEFIFLNLICTPMKIKSLILLLLFFTYFISGFAAANCLEVKPAKTMCCKKMAAKHQLPQKCPKPSGCNTNNCYNCPLSYIATLNALVTVSVQSVPVKKEFGLPRNDKPINFPSFVWKPPNVL